MALSNDLVSQFVKVASPMTARRDPNIYGNAVLRNGQIYVQMDGSDILTPAMNTCHVKMGDRVVIEIKDHSAVIIGNITHPSGSYVDITRVETDLSDRVSDVKTDIDNVSRENESLNGAITDLQNGVNDAIKNQNDKIDIINSKPGLLMTKDSIMNIITKTISDGKVDRVVTTAGTFTDDGLTISKSTSDLETRISDDGMQIFQSIKDSSGNVHKSGVLTADHDGVDAKNLHATTYLIIGNTSRLEDYFDDATGETETACFWIGGI